MPLPPLRRIGNTPIQARHRASCHCGGVVLELDLPDGVVDARRCTCSMCRRKGVVMGAVPLEGLRVLQGQQLLSVYRFNTMTAEHYFCSRCGIYTHHRRRSKPNQYGFNLGCLDGVDPNLVQGVPVNDGVNHPADRVVMSAEPAGRVIGIYIAPEGGAPLAPLPEAILQAGHGIVGDRYFEHDGTFSEKLKDSDDWQVTLIEQEEVERFNGTAGVARSPGEFRRNIVTQGVRLNDLVGRRFRVGGAVLEGIRLCEPCAYLAKLIGPEVLQGMAHRAGLRARILEGALVRPGDAVGA